MFKKKKEEFKKVFPDKSIIIITIAMTIFGLLMIYNASAYIAQQQYDNQLHFLLLQIIWIFIAIILSIPFYILNYNNLAKLSLIGTITLLISLIVVLIFGEEINGAKRWFDFMGFRLQPAELIKPILIIYLSTLIVKKEESKDNKVNNKNLIIYSTIILIISGLIMWQPDMGTTLVIVLTAFAMYLLLSNNKKDIQNLIKALTTIGILATIFTIIEPYRLSRITTFINLVITGEVLDPRGTGYQLQQILIGIGSGGFWGKGFGQSRQRFGYLVENTAFTDSTFAVILEEFGVISALIIIGIWIFFLFKGYQIAKNAPNTLGKSIAIGITIWLTIQALFNMAANVGIIPITGLPLPFLTYGGSSIFATFIGIAILLNISRYKKCTN